MECKYQAIAILTVDVEDGAAKLNNVTISLDLSSNLTRQAYFHHPGSLTREGAKAMTQAFVQGLVANIHTEHQKGTWDSAEHLRYIIAELERGFKRVVEIQEDIAFDPVEPITRLS